MEDKKYYVYRYFITETNETIYIGKGSGDRYKRANDGRSKYFKDMYTTHNCSVQILQHSLSEKEAFELEKMLIYYYRTFTNVRLTNVCDGGEGASGHHWNEEEKKQISYRNQGKRNPNYGNKWSDAQKEALRVKQVQSQRYVGNKNPNSKRIMCVETGEIFETITDAKNKYGVKYIASFSIALKCSYRTAAKMHWKYLPK